MPRNPQRLVALVLFCLTGCGGATPPPESAPSSGDDYDQAPAGMKSEEPSAADQDEPPATLEDAEAALQRAQVELQNALGPMAFAQPPAASQSAPAEAAGSAPRDVESERAEKKADGPNCNLACRAFSSLSRAAQAVCRLDGDGGERCGRARKVVSDAEARLASCTCPPP